MPTIPPRVPTQTQQPTPMPYQRSNAPGLAFGIGGEGLSDLGQGMMRSGLHLGEIASQMRAEDDLAAVKKAGTALSDDLRNMMFGSDGVGGYYAQRGQSAVEGYSRLGTDIDAVIKQHSDGLSNRTQRQMFDQLASKWRISELDQAAHHVAGQRVQALNDVSEGVIRSAIADGTQRFKNEAERNTAFATGYGEILNIVRRNGLPPEEAKARLRGYESEFWSAVIGRAVEDDPTEAQKFLDDNRAALLPESLGQMQTLIGQKMQGLRVDQALSRAMAVPVSGAGTGVSPSGSERFAAGRARIMKDPDLSPDDRAVALSRLDHDEAVENLAQARRGQEARQQAAGMVFGQNRDPTTLSPKLQSSVSLGFMTRMRKAYGAAGKVPFDPVIENDLQKLAMKDPERFADPDKTDLSVYFGRHETARIAYWQAEQRRMASSGGQATLHYPAFADGDRIVAELFPFGAQDRRRAESDPSDSANRFTRTIRAKSAVRAWIDSYYEANGKAPAADELYRYAGALWQQQNAFLPSGRHIGGLHDGPADSLDLEITEGNMPDIAQATGVPVEILPQVIGYLQTRKLPLTHEALTKAYEAGTRGVQEKK